MSATDVLPLTADRIAAYLDERGYAFATTPTGLVGTWDGHPVWFLLQGPRSDVLQVRGRVAGPVRVRDRVATLRALNDWNRARIWPKVYLRAEAEDQVLYAELSTDLRAGVSDVQLAAHLTSALVSVTVALSELGTSLGAAPAS